jgi:hypothetical protein
MIKFKQFQEFEADFLMEHLKNPEYRYGQGFLNVFRDIHDSIDPDECARLWNERDTGLAKRHCLKWVELEEHDE